MENEEYPLVGEQRELLTIREVAAVYRVHEMTVRRHIASGKLPAVRVGRGLRVRRDEMENYIETQDIPRYEDELDSAVALGPDDALFGLIGQASVEAAAALSENKYAALGDAYDDGR